jgi:hypothetical protein
VLSKTTQVQRKNSLTILKCNKSLHHVKEIIMQTAKDLSDQLIFRAKNLQEFVVERDWALIPAGVVKYDIQHTVGEPARIFVHAMTQEEAERQVDDWFGEGVE